MSQVNKSLTKNKIKSSVIQKINKSAHYLGRISKQTSGTKYGKVIGGHQARSSSFQKI